jgi:protein TonB
MSSLQAGPVIGGLGGPGRIRMGGRIMNAQLIHKPSPIYPKEAAEKHVQGTVRLEILVSRDGAVKEVNLLSGDPVLVAAAIDAVRQWRYKPILLNGQPVEAVTTVDVIFTLGR